MCVSIPGLFGSSLLTSNINMGEVWVWGLLAGLLLTGLS